MAIPAPSSNADFNILPPSGACAWAGARTARSNLLLSPRRQFSAVRSDGLPSENTVPRAAHTGTCAAAFGVSPKRERKSLLNRSTKYRVGQGLEINSKAAPSAGAALRLLKTTPVGRTRATTVQDDHSRTAPPP